MPQRFAPVTRAAFWMGGALVSFMSMAIGGRQLSAEIGTFEILTFRSLVGLAVILVILSRTGWHPIDTKALGTHVLRNLAHFAGQYGWFYGIALIPLTEVFAIEFTLPIWTGLLAVLILGERMSTTRKVAVALGFTGVLVILRPGVAAIHPAALAVLAGSFCYAIAYVLTKRLSSNQAPIAILFYMTVIQLPLGLLPALPHWVWPSPGLWPWVVAVALAGLTAHYCLARAMRLADATVVVPLDFLRLPLIAVVSTVFYHEPVSGWVLAGAALVCVAAWLNIRSATPARADATDGAKASPVRR
jgi:drug/metabolite transporter (DMT)-like permease